MKIVPVTFDTVSTEVFKALQSDEEVCIYCVADEYAAVVGTNQGSSFEEISKANIRLIQIKHEGGTIILSPGDVDIGIFTKDFSGHDYRDKIIEKIISLVDIDPSRISHVNNDILIDGKKVIGYGSRRYGEVLYTAIHVSIDANLDLIKKICTKPMKKEPGSLSNYNITSEDIKKIIYEVFA